MQIFNDRYAGVAEMETLKEAVAETEHKEKLQSRAEEVLSYFEEKLQDSRFSVKTLSRVGIPAEEILSVCKEEGVRPRTFWK